MASHKYIIDRETIIQQAIFTAERTGICDGFELQAALSTLVDARESLEYERKVNGGQVYPENRDLWGTLGLNAMRLGRMVPHARDACEALVGAMRPEFSL